MAFQLTLEIEGNDFVLMEFSCQLIQKHDSAGRAVSGVRGGMLEFIIGGTENTMLNGWIADPSSTKDGFVNFYGDGKIKEIKFREAYVITLTESFVVDEYIPFLENERISGLGMTEDSHMFLYRDLLACQQASGNGYVMQFGISAKVVIIDGQEHDNKW